MSARVVSLSGLAARYGRIHFDDPQIGKSYTPACCATSPPRTSTRGMRRSVPGGMKAAML